MPGIQVVFPPIELIERWLRLGGVVPHFMHPATAATMLNSMFGMTVRGEFTISFGTLAGVTSFPAPQPTIAVPLMGGTTRLRVDVLGQALAGVGAEKFVKFTTASDVVGVKASFVQVHPAPTRQPSNAFWSIGSIDEGDAAVLENRALHVGPDADGFDDVTFTGSADVAVHAIRFCEIEQDELNR